MKMILMIMLMIIKKKMIGIHLIIKKLKKMMKNRIMALDLVILKIMLMIKMTIIMDFKDLKAGMINQKKKKKK